MTEYTPTEGQVRAWCREGTGDYPDVMDGWLDRFLARVRRDAAREALDGLARHADKTANERRSLPAIERWDTICREVRRWRDTHYPETEDQT